MKKPDEIAEVRVLRDGVEHEFRISLRPVSLFRMSLRFYLVMSIGFYLYMCAYAFILEMHTQSGIFVQNDQAILKWATAINIPPRNFGLLTLYRMCIDAKLETWTVIGIWCTFKGFLWMNRLVFRSDDLHGGPSMRSGLTFACVGMAIVSHRLEMDEISPQTSV